MARRLCALSVDLDPLTAYYAIYGLGDPPRQLRQTILRKALPRFEELFAELGVPATFFLVGRELETCEEAQDLVRRLATAGHELGNHTYTHPYDLGRLSEDEVESEVRRCHELIVSIAGAEHAPVGFRAPGYGLNAKVLRVISRQGGYQYDSSVFPSPPYYLVKIAVIAGMSLRGRRSGSVLGDPRALTAPRGPYRPDSLRPWKRGDSPLVELPVSVLPWSRLPTTGTLLALSPERVRRYLLSSMQQQSFFNLELHGIDLADAVSDRIPTELAGRQADLRVPFTEKRRKFLQSIEELKRHFEFVTLKDAAAAIRAEGAL